MGNVQLTEGSQRRYLNWLRREKLVCIGCGEELRPGDEIHRCGKLLRRENQFDVKLSGNKNCRFYHAECFEGLFLEL
jgi:hypothetical protein